MWWKLELSFSQRIIQELSFSLSLFGWNEMGCFNSSQVSLFIGEGCDFLQEWVVNANKWATFTKLLITLIFNFLSGVCKSQGQRNLLQALKKCSTTSYACLGMYSSISHVFEFICLLECEPTLIMEEFSTFI